MKKLLSWVSPNFNPNPYLLQNEEGAVLRPEQACYPIIIIIIIIIITTGAPGGGGPKRCSQQCCGRRYPSPYHTARQQHRHRYSKGWHGLAPARVDLLPVAFKWRLLCCSELAADRREMRDERGKAVLLFSSGWILFFSSLLLCLMC